MSEGTAAREAALEILRRVRAGQLFDTARQTAVADLNAADRRLAHEIAAGVLRRRSALDRRLKPLVSGNWRHTPPDVKDLLRIGAFQLTELDRVPPYGAVHATVEVTKHEQGDRSAGLVNAVLRRVANRGPVPAARHAAPADRLADEFSHPAWLVKRWLRTYGPARTRALLAHNNRRPDLVVQPARRPAGALEAALNAAGVAYTAGPLGFGLTIHGAVVEQLPGYADGAFIVQDDAQAWLLDQLRIPSGSVVWDACAAPGGKAVIVSRDCRVVASELKRHRIDRLRDTLRRVSPDVPLIVADARHPPVNRLNVDVVLVDAPCTATGTFARHPDARWRLSPRRLERATLRQAGILSGAAVAVRQGGVLIYLTCSLEPEENAEQINRFLEHHPTFIRDQDDLLVFPPDSGTDGGYAAKLRRV